VSFSAQTFGTMADQDIVGIESLFMALPGGRHPIGRMAIAGGIGAGISLGLKPSVSYFPSGEPRPFILFESTNPEATIWPWWAWIALPAVTFGILL